MVAETQQNMADSNQAIPVMKDYLHDHHVQLLER